VGPKLLETTGGWPQNLLRGGGKIQSKLIRTKGCKERDGGTETKQGKGRSGGGGEHRAKQYAQKGGGYWQRVGRQQEEHQRRGEGFKAFWFVGVSGAGSGKGAGRTKKGKEGEKGREGKLNWGVNKMSIISNEGKNVIGIGYNQAS